MDMKKIEQIVATIEHHLAVVKAGMVDNNPKAVDSAGENIAGLGDMIRDAIS